MAKKLLYSDTYGVKEVILSDCDSGLFKKYSMYTWTSKTRKVFYVFIMVNGKPLRLHRFLLGAKKGQVVDHINGNPLDNRRENIRLTTQIENNKNASKRTNARTSKYKGVHFDSKWKKWKAQIQCDKKKIALGTFKTELEAVLAYNEAAIKYHGEFAKINSISEQIT